MKNLSVNRLAWQLLERLIEDSTFYRVEVEETDSGTTIIDAGINAEGGLEAGRIITEICMGGCGNATIIAKTYADIEFPSILVYTDHPVFATLGSQFAGWHIREEGYSAIGSGPARALALKPKEIFQEIGYKDDFDKGVLTLETDKRPPPKLIDRIANDCKISPQHLAVILTPTASTAGATQVSGRIVETGVHKLKKIGVDPKTILYAWGTAPIPPIHPKSASAMARTNDAILYGGIAYYALRHDSDDELKKLVEKSSSKASKDYGKPFLEVFKESKYDFYNIDPDLFAPAIVIINNVRTGTVFRTGEINPEALKASFSIEAV